MNIASRQNRVTDRIMLVKRDVKSIPIYITFLRASRYAKAGYVILMKAMDVSTWFTFVVQSTLTLYASKMI